MTDLVYFAYWRTDCRAMKEDLPNSNTIAPSNLIYLYLPDHDRVRL
jgi:hypothetical protein